MKRFVLLAALLLAAPAVAQAPREITATDTVELQVGQAKMFQIVNGGRGITDIENAADTVAQVSFVRTNQQVRITGVNVGETLVSFVLDDSTIIRMNVVVGGRAVRIYGTGTNDEKKTDYIGYFCTSTWCGRADQEIDQPETRTTVQRTRRNSRGDIITTTK